MLRWKYGVQLHLRDKMKDMCVHTLQGYKKGE